MSALLAKIALGIGAVILVLVMGLLLLGALVQWMDRREENPYEKPTPR